MPTRLIPGGDRRLLTAVGGVALLLIVLGIILVPERDRSDTPTTYSVGSGGAKAAYVLLEAAHYSVQRWEESILELPTGSKATFILAEPEGFPTAAERDALRRFIEQGGRVVAIGASAASFLPEHDIVRDPVAAMTWRRLSSQSPTSITRETPEITMAPAAYWGAATFALPLYGDGIRTHVVTYVVGDGEAIWWASATPLTNSGLREPGNLAFFLACLGDSHRRVYWDEYFHGHRRSSAVTSFDSDLKWIGLQLLFMVAAVLLTYSRRSGPVVPAMAESRLSPLEFVRTLGSLYQRAGAASIAVDIAFQRFRYQLTRRLGIRSDVSARDLDRAVRDRWNVADAGFVGLLEACESARSAVDLTPSAALTLTQSLSDWCVTLGLRGTSHKERS
jgi:Domain of unknown function (DUF4350)